MTHTTQAADTTAEQSDNTTPSTAENPAPKSATMSENRAKRSRPRKKNLAPDPQADAAPASRTQASLLEEVTNPTPRKTTRSRRPKSTTDAAEQANTRKTKSKRTTAPQKHTSPPALQELAMPSDQAAVMPDAPAPSAPISTPTAPVEDMAEHTKHSPTTTKARKATNKSTAKTALKKTKARSTTQATQILTAQPLPTPEDISPESTSQAATPNATPAPQTLTSYTPTLDEGIAHTSQNTIDNTAPSVTPEYAAPNAALQSSAPKTSSGIAPADALDGVTQTTAPTISFTTGTPADPTNQAQATPRTYEDWIFAHAALRAAQKIAEEALNQATQAIETAASTASSTPFAEQDTEPKIYNKVKSPRRAKKAPLSKAQTPSSAMLDEASVATEQAQPASQANTDAILAATPAVISSAVTQIEEDDNIPNANKASSQPEPHVLQSAPLTSGEGSAETPIAPTSPAVSAVSNANTTATNGTIATTTEDSTDATDTAVLAQDSTENAAPEATQDPATADAPTPHSPMRKNRRGRRGGRSRKHRKTALTAEALPLEQIPSTASPTSNLPVAQSAPNLPALPDSQDLPDLPDLEDDYIPTLHDEDMPTSPVTCQRHMYISVLPSEQVEVAIVENGIVQEYYLEMRHQVKMKGNIYKGIIHNIDTNLQAAFVNYGGHKNGFLQIDEIHPEYFLTHHEPIKGKKHPPIQKVLRPGQEVLVQVVKEPNGSKGAFLTTWLSLAGRFLVLTPGQEQIGISRKVENDEERARLREMMAGIDPGEGLGVIVRTVSAGTSKTTLKNDLQYLKRVWKDIRKRGTTDTAPCLIYQEPRLAERAVRDYLTEDVCEIWVDNAEMANAIRETANLLFPRKMDLVKVHADHRQGMWERFNLQRQLEQIYAREVTLPSGGRLVFDQTEALLAIDINSGKISGKTNFEAMAHRTNMEAAEAIARQLKLRDIGGQVVIDFIEMRDKNHIREVEKTLRLAMKNDRARHDVSRMSNFGLLELVRQRTGSSALSITMESCPHCGGTGLRRNMEWQALQALRDIRRLLAASREDKCIYATSAEVGLHLLNHKRQTLQQMEQLSGKSIEISLRP